jgi:TRAP-type C4-dicarboxylate transport system permease small subunit
MRVRLGTHPWIDRLAALTERVARAMRFLASATLLAAVALNIANVAGRYFFSAPIEWAEEVMLFMMVGVVFLGAVAVSHEGRQIRMDIVLQALPRLPRRIAEMLAEVVELGVALAITVLAVPLVVQLYQFDQRSQAAQLPVAYPQALLPLGFALIAVVIVVRLVRR